jgi:hypothetical protein
MGQFKPMVKMMTTEPTVELKLKKGGHVAGHSAMKSTMPMEERDEKHVASGKSPKKPSIMERRKSMSGAMLNSKKGGVAKKADGGMMGAPMGAPAGAMNPAMKKALMMRMMAQRGAMRPGMAAPAAPMAPAMKKGGKAEGSKMDKAQDKAMIMKAFKEHDAQEHKGGKGTKLKLKNGGTTKVVDGDKKDTAHGTGVIKMGKPGGYAAGGTIEGNEGKFKNTKVVDGDKNDSAHGTGGVRMANAGGFKRGGNIIKKAEGGSTNWENRPANGTPPGKTNTKTGEVKESNAGGYKKGGAAKKHLATGGSVNNAGHAVAMPRKPVSRPVANSLQSGTFKKGGKVHHKADGGGMPMADDGYDPIVAREAARRNMESETMRRENEATPVMDSVKKLLGIRPNAGAGRGFVNPTMTRKAGGRAC